MNESKQMSLHENIGGNQYESIDYDVFFFFKQKTAYELHR